MTGYWHYLPIGNTTVKDSAHRQAGKTCVRFRELYLQAADVWPIAGSMHAGQMPFSIGNV